MTRLMMPKQGNRIGPALRRESLHWFSQLLTTSKTAFYAGEIFSVKRLLSSLSNETNLRYSSLV